MTWIQTYSGRKFWPLNPRVEDVCLEDIAHALSLKCRFNGHCRTFYSVAQHSVLVAESARSPEALFHDSPESYLPDICRPIKGAWKEFAEIELRLLNVIYRAFGLGCKSKSEWDKIEFWDDTLLATEKRDLFDSQLPWEALPVTLTNVIEPWSSEVSKRKFLDACETFGIKLSTE